jgi:hypothetical protein
MSHNLRPALPNLHDAILERIEIDWEAAIATLHLSPVGDRLPPTLALVFRGLREVQVPRYEPWGPSIYVNDTEYEDGSDEHDLTLRLEMQSGDEIRLRAASLEIT